MQWGALALAALRVPLAAQYPQPAEFQTVRLLLAVQFVGSAILFPMLCRGWGMTAATIASACVLLLIGSALSGWELASALPMMAVPAIWIAALWLWHGALPQRRARAVIAACAATYVLGGALLWYFQLEAIGGSELTPSLAYGPLELVISNPQSPPAATWWCVSTALAVGAAVRALSLGWAWHRRRSTAS